jgi:hypothetical protein
MTNHPSLRIDVKTRQLAEDIRRRLDTDGAWEPQIDAIQDAIYDIRRQTLVDYLLAVGPQLRG